MSFSDRAAPVRTDPDDRFGTLCGRKDQPFFLCLQKRAIAQRKRQTEERQKGSMGSVVNAKELLIKAVPAAVAEYGVSGVSTRNIAEIAGVSDGNIYRFFDGRDDLLCHVYKESNERLFRMVIQDIDDLRDNNRGLHLKECTWIVLRNVWRMLLNDPDTCRFQTDYYSSCYFEKYALAFHEEKIREAAAHLSWLFRSGDDAARCIRYVFTLLYDSVKQVLDGRLPDDEETMNLVLEDLFNVLYILSNRWPFRTA